MGVVTTGSDVRAETDEANRGLAERLAGVREPHDAGSVEEARQPSGIFPEPVVLDDGVDTDVGEVPVRVFVPHGPRPRGVHVHLHGGGGVLGSHRTQDVALQALAEATGLAVATVGYRLAPEHPHPAAIDDTEIVLRAALEGSDLGPSRVSVGGESFGGYLALMALLRLRDRPAATTPLAAYLAYPIVDLALTPSARAGGDERLVISTEGERWFSAQLCPDLDDEGLRDPSVSPLYADLGGLPTMRVVVGSEDLLLDDSLFVAARLGAAGVGTTLEVVDGGVHGFTAFPLTVARREADAKVRFLADAHD